MAPKTARSRSSSAKSGSADSGEMLATLLKKARVDDTAETSMQVDGAAQAGPRESSMRQAPKTATAPSVVNMNAERTHALIGADLANMEHAYSKIMLLGNALEEYQAAYNSLRAHLKKNGQFIYYPHFKVDGALPVVSTIQFGIQRLQTFSKGVHSTIATFSDNIQKAVTDTAVPVRERIGSRPPALLTEELIATRRLSYMKANEIPSIVKAYKRTFPSYRFTRYEAEKFMSEFHYNIGELMKYFGKNYIVSMFDEKDIYWLISAYLGENSAVELFGDDFVKKYLSKESEIGADRSRFTMN